MFPPVRDPSESKKKEKSETKEVKAATKPPESKKFKAEKNSGLGGGSSSAKSK